MIKKINIKGLDDIKAINQAASDCNYDVWLHSKSTMVDAKSILGLLTLDFNEQIDLVVEDGVNPKHLFNKLSDYIAK